MLCSRFARRVRLPASMLIASCWLLAAALLTTTAGADELTPAGRDFFEQKIRPVLIEHCFKCHSTAAGKTEGGLSFDNRSAMRVGGASGPAVVPSDEERSLILAAIRHDGLEMPPDRKLPPEVIADFEKWIALGAPDPRDGVGAAAQPTVNYAEARKHWAFQPVRVVPPPEVADAAWPLDPIDRYILAKLEAAGRRPATEATPDALMRRTTFLLTGLPPTPEEVESFVGKLSPTPPRARTPTPTPSTVVREHGGMGEDTYHALLDRLLSSMAFGERWGRHWLDVARYAETNGKSMNLVWPHAWRYRDYVISAFNRDVPYDQFLREQLAGDLLPAADDTSRAHQTTATGLLAIGAKTYEEGGTREKFLLELADDQIDVVTRGMLGLTVACARCHDHKFDPIPQADYYALVGVFQSSDTLCGPGPKHNGYKGYDAEYQPVGKDAAKLHGPFEAHEKTLRAKNTELGAGRSSRYRHVKNKTSLEIDRKKVAAEMPADEAKLAEIDAKLKVEEAKIAEWDAKNAALQKDIEALEKSYPQSPDYVMAVREGAAAADCAVRLRGDWKRPGPFVPRGAPSLFASQRRAKVGPGESGRLQLAAWVTDPQNPLTARVAVNRIWHHVFGSGLVATLDNFGTLGDRPSHPELLDYLAAEFIRDGWGTKRLIRRLMLTRTYRLGLDERSPLAAADPGNRLFGRRTHQRLEAEAVRDAMLAVAGMLEREPPQGSQVIQSKVSSANALETAPPAEIDRTCRTVYLTLPRSAVPDMLTLFDFPDPSLPASRRDRRTLPTQALFMMNSPTVVKLAEGFAERVLADESAVNDAARIDLAHRLCLGRSVSTAESARALAFLRSQQDVATLEATTAPRESKPIDARLAAWATFCQTLFASAEFRYLP